MLGIFSLIVLLFSLVLHEVSHGWVALSLGDTTAKDAGRLTLNPIKHLDLFGSILFPLFLYWMGSPVLFGWAKPVPVNPYNLRDPKWGIFKVSLAGPAANFLVAIFFGLLIRVVPLPVNLLPFLAEIVGINLLWGFFNLVPIPPLDGGQILFSLLPDRFSELKTRLYRYGPIILLLFIVFGFGILNRLVSLIFNLLIG
jgi:Zn-dependent protease